jgi:hypothetical protein
LRKGFRSCQWPFDPPCLRASLNRRSPMPCSADLRFVCAGLRRLSQPFPAHENNATPSRAPITPKHGCVSARRPILRQSKLFKRQTLQNTGLRLEFLFYILQGRRNQEWAAQIGFWERAKVCRRAAFRGAFFETEGQPFRAGCRWDKCPSSFLTGLDGPTGRRTSAQGRAGAALPASRAETLGRDALHARAA